MLSSNGVLVVHKQLKTAVLVASVLAVSPAAKSSESINLNQSKSSALVYKTGSRIQHEAIQASPLIIITRQEIERSGENSAADLLRNIVLNSRGSYRPQSGSSIQGMAELDLFGMGASRTLILVDGRSMAKSPFSGDSEDLTTIAISSIERIEILPGGASATYGSKASAGVVNIITRTDVDGIELSIRGAKASLAKQGGERTAGSLLVGHSTSDYKVSAGAAWNNRDIILVGDSYHLPDSSLYGNNYSTVAPNGFDNFDFTAIPNGAGGVACDFENSAFFTNGARCDYDFQQESADEASSKNQSFWVNGSAQLTNSLQAWASISLAKSSSFGRYAPTPDSSYFSTPLSTNSPNNPSNPNGNVYDATRFAGNPTQVTWWHRFDALGNRDGYYDSQLTDIRFGIDGQLDRFTWDAGMRYTGNHTEDLGKNYVLRDVAAQNIESGAYDLLNPYNSAPSVLDSMKIDILRKGEDELSEVWANASFDLFQIDDRQAKLLVGFTYQKEALRDIKDSLLEAGLVGGSSSNSGRVTINYFNNISKSGTRNNLAYYFELFSPLTDSIDLSYQGRIDSYDDLDSQFSSSILGNWRATEKLNVNLSYSENFVAARLDLLSIQPRTFDSNVSGGAGLIPTTVTNQYLQAEESNTLLANLSYRASDSAGLKLSYINNQINNRARFFDAAYILINANDGLAGLGVSGVSSTGLPTGVVIGYGNKGTIDVKAIILEADINYSLKSAAISHSFRINQLSSYDLDGSDWLNQSSDIPKSRANLKSAVELDQFSMAWNVNMIDSTSGNNSSPTWVTHDIQFNYQTNWNGKFTFGVQNISEKKPPLETGNVGRRDYDMNLYNAYGRISYLEYSQYF